MNQPLPGKPLFSLPETYRIVVQALRTVPCMVRGERQGLLSPVLRERLMMAVTQVNGCAMCSYYHSKMALETGMDAREIQNLLSGTWQDVPEHDYQALLFAQHYADTRGKPDAAAWNAITAQYGEAAALAMLGAIRGIMMGNAYGIPAGSLLRRLGLRRFHADKRSTMGYEIALLLSSVVLVPAAAAHAGIESLLRRPVKPQPILRCS